MRNMVLTYADRILKHHRYKDILKEIEKQEENRIFCRHDMEHFLSVARIAWIACKTYGLEIAPDLIYATALLHDIGRAAQYHDAVPHDVAGAEIARDILRDVGADAAFTDAVCACILQHRHKQEKQDTPTSFAQIFAWADKKSRNCFCCKAQDVCNWKQEKRNMKIEI
jgi:putative nucleotidyltransferase with HDIG domain